MANCIECSKEYTPFVDGHTLMCDKCYNEFIQGVSNEDSSGVDNKNSSEESAKQNKQHSETVIHNYVLPYDYKINMEELQSHEKYHKSLKFHSKFYK